MNGRPAPAINAWLGAVALCLTGCEGDTEPLSPAPLDHLERGDGDARTGPPVEALLQTYSAAFEAGETDAIGDLLAPDFQYEIAGGCVGRAACGITFPWSRAEELAWIDALIQRSNERHCEFHPYPGEAAALPGHRWSTRSQVSLGYDSPIGNGGYCYGVLEVEFEPGGPHGWVLTRMTARQWLRDDDGCGLVHFRCFN